MIRRLVPKEAQFQAPKATHRAAHAEHAPDAGITLPWESEGREQGPAGSLGLACPDVCHQLSNLDKRASSPISWITDVQALVLGLGHAGGGGGGGRRGADLIHGALTRLCHKGGAGALGEVETERHDAEPCREHREMAQTAAGAVESDVAFSRTEPRWTFNMPTV